MRTSFHLFLSTLTLAAGGLSFSMPASAAAPAAPKANAFTLSSPDLKDGKFGMDFVLNGFGCTGKNISPALEWRNAPAGTQSFALMVHDKDAPTGSGFWHWSVFNMPASTTGLPQGAGNSPDTLPKPAIGGNNDYAGTGAAGNGSYGGPCPPEGHGVHHYTFTLYALDVPDMHAAAGIPVNGTPALHGFALNHGLGKHVLGKAQLKATFERK